MTNTRKNYLRNRYKKINTDIDDLTKVYLEDITTELFHLFNNTDKIQDEEINKVKDKVINLIYNFIEEVYNLTLNSLKNMYKKVNNDINTEHLHPYNKDGKTLETRIDYWINDFMTRINHGSLNVKNFSVNVMEKILQSEGQTAKNQMLKEKVGTLAEFVVIESSDGCEDCGQYDGEYPIMEIPEDGPPFHPNCRCNMYYDYSDQEDELEDLELEDDEKEEI